MTESDQPAEGRDDLPAELLILNRYGIGYPYLYEAQRIAQKRGLEPFEVLIARGIISKEIWIDAQLQLDAERRNAYLRRRRRDFLLHQAINNLYESASHYSAKVTFERNQIVMIVGALCGLACFIYFGASDLIFGVLVLVNAFYFLHIILRGLILADVELEKVRAKDLVFVDDETLPVYSVCVALYKEKEQVRDLALHLYNLDWPKQKLDIKLICEANDKETIAAISELNLPPCFDLIIVPEASPQTKPKALNYALPHCRGEFLVLYDAEDRPSSGQLREAFAKFSDGEENLACLQAPLHIHNAEQSWLTRMFAIEYFTLFNGVLPVLAKWRTILPLGGTSNHFKTDILKTVGAWDPYNVTEDADLGVRLFREGYFCGTLTLPTFEEAPPDFKPWKTQRTRWLKGWMQTILVHSRNPLRFTSEMGFIGSLTFHLLLTALVLSVLIHPFMLVLLSWNVYSHMMNDSGTASAIFMITAVFNLVGGYTTYSFLAFIVLKSLGKLQLAPFVLYVPIYWILISIASWRALFQLVHSPHKWEKTPHALADHNFRLIS